MPNVDTYGTQQPIAWLKFYIEKGYIYERKGQLDQMIIKDTQFVGATLPPGGGTNSIDPRFLSLFVTFTILFPNEANVERIYHSILSSHLQTFENLKEKTFSQKVTQMTVKLYNALVESLPRTPIKFHYIFNLRDLSRVYEGLLRSTVDHFADQGKFIRLWRNEVSRVFSDKLIQKEDQDLVHRQVEKLV